MQIVPIRPTIQPQTKKAISRQIEACREVLKENPSNEDFRILLESCIKKLRSLKS